MLAWVVFVIIFFVIFLLVSGISASRYRTRNVKVSSTARMVHVNNNTNTNNNQTIYQTTNIRGTGPEMANATSPGVWNLGSTAPPPIMRPSPVYVRSQTADSNLPPYSP
ncbi:uncharacterized protein RJT20DRAFT_129090 [Scheffersomyces xylosifermentans]|uniref:uncharacterized protein n=1 Tax=Scheffersomyces xylosifermentans TaxID=1304137 RepID=UPI00315DF29F